MQTFIIKPLNIVETESIKTITGRFKEKNKIYIITGAEKVGKTALSIKILCYLLKETQKDFKPIFISLDNTAEYWQNLIQLNKEIFRYPFKHKPAVSWGGICMALDKELLDQQYNFIVIDGIDKCKDVMNEKEFENIFLAVVNFSKTTNATVFITGRTNQLSLAHPCLIEAQQEGSLEFWHLERPGYLGGDIKEFGDTKLEIQ